MKFIDNLSEEEYKSFWETVPNNHFMQSYGWGQACKKNREQIPYYVGLKNNDKLIAVALLLKKQTPLNMCYFYVPRGFTLDYNDKEILSEFTKGLKEFLKKEKAIYLKIDPPVMYQEIDEEANKVEGGKNNYEIYNYLLELGYKHKGFYKLYEGNQPRYTFRTYFDKYENFEEVEKNFSKSFTKPLKKSYNYDIEVYESKDINLFHELIEKIAAKNDFRSYSKSYYKNVFNELIKDNQIKIFNAKINIKYLIEKLTKQLETEKNNDKRNKIEKDIEYFKEKNQEEYTCASLICTYSKTGAWSLYIGNDEVATYTGTVNRLYYEFMKDAYDNKYEYSDLFGVVGDPHTEYKNLAGIYEYKRKFGGEYIEFMGEFDLIMKPIWYKLLPPMLKIYRKLRKKG